LFLCQCQEAHDLVQSSEIDLAIIGCVAVNKDEWKGLGGHGGGEGDGAGFWLEAKPLTAGSSEIVIANAAKLRMLENHDTPRKEMSP
jgi:hypothetical protein